MNRHKFILQIFLGLFLTSNANNSFAMCSASGFRVFPHTKTINSNSIFIIDGYSSSRSIIRELNKGYPVYLSSEGDTIPLIVIKTLESQFGRTQSVLKPSLNLVPGKHYKLNIDNLEEYQKMIFETKNISWTVSGIADRQKPIWKKLPSYNSKGMIFYGCGPSVFVNFCACVSDSSPVVLYAKVRNLKTNLNCDYYLNIDSCSFRLGHGMCSGEFEFKEGQEYEATFSLMDASGNVSIGTQPIKFVSPTRYDFSKHEHDKVNCDCSTQKTTEEQTFLWIIITLVAVGLVVLLVNRKRLSSKKPN